MATIPSPTKPVARSTNEAGSGTRGGPPILALAFAVVGNSIPTAIQYTDTDFITPGYFLRRRMMATIPSPPKPVARSTNEAGSGTGAELAFAVAGKSMAAIIQYTDFIHPPVGPETATTLTKHDSYHECKILKTKLRQRQGCGIVKISCTQVMTSPVRKTSLL